MLCGANPFLSSQIKPLGATQIEQAHCVKILVQKNRNYCSTLLKPKQLKKCQPLASVAMFILKGKQREENVFWFMGISGVCSSGDRWNR